MKCRATQVKCSSFQLTHEPSLRKPVHKKASHQKPPPTRTNVIKRVLLACLHHQTGSCPPREWIHVVGVGHPQVHVRLPPGRRLLLHGRHRLDHRSHLHHVRTAAQQSHLCHGECCLCSFPVSNKNRYSVTSFEFSSAQALRMLVKL